MINALDFRGIIKEMIREELGDRNSFKIGTIAAIEDKPRILFDGETIISGKGYSFLQSYDPNVGDRVLLAKMNGTYVIQSKIITDIESSGVNIIESGENTNGKHTKYSDGTLHCYSKVGGRSFQAGYNEDIWIHPAPFTDRPNITITPGTPVNDVNLWRMGFNNRDSSNTQTVISIYNEYTGPLTAYWYASAVGKWK